MKQLKQSKHIVDLRKHTEQAKTSEDKLTVRHGTLSSLTNLYSAETKPNPAQPDSASVLNESAPNVTSHTHNGESLPVEGELVQTSEKDTVTILKNEPLSGINAFSKSVNAPEFQDPKVHPPKSRRVGTKEDKKNSVHHEIFAHEPAQLHTGYHSVITRLYNLIAAVGVYAERIMQVLFKLLKILKLIMVSPITIVNFILELLVSLTKKILSSGIALFVFFKNIQFKPPRTWYRELGVFTLIAFLFIAPVKIYDTTVKLLQAREQVLGASTQIVKYAALTQSLKEYLPAITVAKEFAGFNGPRRLLVVFQNNAELRPTGGFMGSYALIDTHNGSIEQLDIPGGGFYDLKAGITRCIEAPQPFHIFSPCWQVWNANWFTDVPHSARKLMHFYEITSGGSTVDGVLFITPDIIEDILKLTGPLVLEEYDQIISADNFRTQTQLEVEIEYDREQNTPKAFIADLFPLVIERIVGLIEQDKSRELLGILDTALSERSLLAYTTNADVQQVLNNLGWSGALKKTPSDYLLVSHTNIGGGKTDLAIKDYINVDTQFTKTGAIINTVTLTRTHTGNTDDIFEGHDNLDYVRFYVPEGSQLMSALGFVDDDIADRFKQSSQPYEEDDDLAAIRQVTSIDLTSNTEIFEEDGKTVFAHWLSVKPGQSKTAVITYRLPFSYTNTDTYSLYWQKQPGTSGTPISTRVRLPETIIFENWYPKTSHVQLVSDSELRYSNDLRTDKVFSFTYR